MVEFQIAKKNRLKVYRQTIKQEIAEGSGATADDVGTSVKSFDKSVASFSVGSKKLIIKSASSTSTAALAAAETKPKLLLLDPVGEMRKKSDKTVDSDKNNNDDSVKTANSAMTVGARSIDISKIVSNVYDLKLNSTGAGVSIECCNNKKAVAAHWECVEIDAEVNVDNTAQQMDTVTMKAAKKRAAAGTEKGNHFIIDTVVGDIA